MTNVAAATADDDDTRTHTNSTASDDHHDGTTEEESAGKGSEGLCDNSGEDMCTSCAFESMDTESGADGADRNEGDAAERELRCDVWWLWAARTVSSPWRAMWCGVVVAIGF